MAGGGAGGWRGVQVAGGGCRWLEGVQVAGGGTGGRTGCRWLEGVLVAGGSAGSWRGCWWLEGVQVAGGGVGGWREVQAAGRAVKRARTDFPQDQIPEVLCIVVLCNVWEP